MQFIFERQKYNTVNKTITTPLFLIIISILNYTEQCVMILNVESNMYLTVTLSGLGIQFIGYK
jgi:hypothetical protein